MYQVSAIYLIKPLSSTPAIFIDIVSSCVTPASSNIIVSKILCCLQNPKKQKSHSVLTSSCAYGLGY